VIEDIIKIKVLSREYQIPAGDPAGTLRIAELRNNKTIRIYTTLRRALVIRTSVNAV